jgi:hypothetical protein
MPWTQIDLSLLLFCRRKKKSWKVYIIWVRIFINFLLSTTILVGQIDTSLILTFFLSIFVCFSIPHRYTHMNKMRDFPSLPPLVIFICTFIFVHFSHSVVMLLKSCSWLIFTRCILMWVNVNVLSHLNRLTVKKQIQWMLKLHHQNWWVHGWLIQLKTSRIKC